MALDFVPPLGVGRYVRLELTSRVLGRLDVGLLHAWYCAYGRRLRFGEVPHCERRPQELVLHEECRRDFCRLSPQCQRHIGVHGAVHHLVPAPSTTPAGSASGVVCTSSMPMMSVMLTCFHRTPWGSVPTSTLWPSRTAPSIMLRMGGCAMVSLRLCTKDCAQSAVCPPLSTVRRCVWATTIVPSRIVISGSSLLLFTPVLVTMAALPLALLCPGTSLPLVLLSAAHPPACSRPQLNRLNGPQRSPATAPGRAPGPLLLYA